MHVHSEKDKKYIPESVRRLKICMALRGCGQVSVSECLKSTRKEHMFVYDDQTLEYTDWAEDPRIKESKCFKTVNPSRKELVLLPMDNRIVTGPRIKQGGVADCALLTAHGLSLVEFKTNASSSEPFSIVANIEKGISQLWRTYDELLRTRCKACGVDITEGMEIDFYVVFDKELDVTSAMSERMEMMTKFLLEHGYPLSFENEKVFK